MNGQLEDTLGGEPAADSLQNNLTWPKQDHQPTRSGILCRLCAEPCGDGSLLIHFKKFLDNSSANVLPNAPSATKSNKGIDVDNADLMLLIDKTLPIKVSQSDPLPKQVCLKCAERLKESYSFVLSVINAESILRSMADRKCFCASEVSSKEEESVSSPEVVSPRGLVRVSLPSGPKYCCPLCSTGVVGPSNDPPIPLVKKLVVPEKAPLQRNNVAWDGTIIKMERDETEPTPEELERSYRDLFDVRDWRTERQSWPRSQPAGRRGYKGRPRGRPRGRTKMIPRGRRGSKRLTHTTVERILELSGSQMSNKNDVVRVRSGSDRLHADALTQCLLCEGWLPGMAACLQHALLNHTDCGVFLCPRCQQDDFPGEFELIQHFQEHHCPDLELCEGSDDDSSPSKNTAVVVESCDSDIPQTPSMYSEDTDMTRPQSRLSTRTGSCGPDVTERSDIEIKQNGESSINISHELTLNSFLEDKASQDLKESANVEYQEATEVDPGIVTSITEEPPVTVEPVATEPEDGDEDREDTDEQDTKSDTKSDFRKDSEDPEGGGGNNMSGNSNNVADDSNSLGNGDTSSQNIQPDYKGGQTDGVSGTDCGNSLHLSRLLSDVLSTQKLNLRHTSITKRSVTLGRKPKRIRLHSSILNMASKRSFKMTVSYNSRHQRSPRCVGFRSINGNYEDISNLKSAGCLRKHISQIPSFINGTAKRRKIF